MHPEVSMIIPTLNGGRYLKRSLASITNQNTLIPYKLIVADSESTDGSRSVAERYADVIAQCEGQGIGAGRHCGAKHAGGQYLMFIGADTMGFLGTLYYYTQLDLGHAIDGGTIDKMSKKLGIANLRDYGGIRW